MSTGPTRGNDSEEAGTRPIPSQPSDVATQSSNNTTVTSSNPTEDNSTNMSSTAPDDLAAQSSAGTATNVTSSETMSLPSADHGESPSTHAATGDTSRRPPPPIPASLASPLGRDAEQGLHAPAAEEAEGGEREPPVRDVTWFLQRCGLNRVNRMSRFLLAWLGVVFLVLFLNALVCVAVLVGVHGDKHYAVSPTDTHVQGQGFEIFCSDFTVRGSVAFSAYLLHHPAKLDPHNRLLYTAERNFRLSGWKDTADLHYYLLPGSTVTIQTCLQVAGCVDLLTFKGERNYEQWRDGSCLTCYETAERFTTTDCRNSSYVADDAYTYYFVYTSCQDTPSIGTGRVYLNRSVYDVSDALYAWVNTTECVIHPDWHQTSAVVWQTEAFTASNPGVDGVVSTSCRYRLALVLTVFGCVPYFLFLFSCMVIYDRCKGPRTPRLGARLGLRRLLPRSPDEISPLLEMGQADKPPAYDDLPRTGTPPPPYAEVQGQGLLHS